MRCDCVAFRNSDGRQKYPLIRNIARCLPELRAFLLADLQIFVDLLQLHFRIDRADVGVFIQRIADDQRLHAILQFADHRLINAFLHQQPRTGAADVALVEKDSVDDSFDGLIDRGVLENNVGRLAAEFQREMFFRTRPVAF